MSAEAHRTVRAIYGIEAPRIVAVVTRIVRDLGLAEEIAQDALVAALEEWPARGVPDNPGAWLMATAKNRAVNALRRRRLGDRKVEELGHAIEAGGEGPPSAAELDAAIDDAIGDDVLRLIFMTCHPVLPTEARVALTLRVLGGLTTDEIARAFLVSEAAVAQRIVRAKKTLAEAKVPFELPARAELDERLASVLEVVYLVFNEGYAATAGDDAMRPALVEDALRLGRTLAELAPNEPEALGLIALMELHASRSAARTDAKGEPVLLLEQDRGRWSQLLIRRGLGALDRGERIATRRGPYLIQAAISACHARARVPADTDFARIAGLYAELAAIRPSPVVELNRAMAVAMAEGPAAGLALVDALAEAPSLQNYHLLPSARADLLKKLGRLDEAQIEFEKAAKMTRNARQREQLLALAASCVAKPT